MKPLTYYSIDRIIADDRGRTVAVTEGVDADRNGEFLAAAPDMYSALLSCRWLLETLVKMDRIPANSEALRDTLAAIAKAEPIPVSEHAGR